MCFPESRDFGWELPSGKGEMEPTELGPLLKPSALFNTLLVYTMSHRKGILLLMALLENQPVTL